MDMTSAYACLCKAVCDVTTVSFRTFFVLQRSKKEHYYNHGNNNDAIRVDFL